MPESPKVRDCFRGPGLPWVFFLVHGDRLASGTCPPASPGANRPANRPRKPATRLGTALVVGERPAPGEGGAAARRKGAHPAQPEAVAWGRTGRFRPFRTSQPGQVSAGLGTTAKSFGESEESVPKQGVSVWRFS